MKLSPNFFFSELTAKMKMRDNDGKLLQRLLPPGIQTILMTDEPSTTVGWEPKNGTSLDEESFRILGRSNRSMKLILFFFVALT